jgi:hypothetical protein
LRAGAHTKKQKHKISDEKGSRKKAPCRAFFLLFFFCGIQILLKKAPLLRYTVIRSIQGFLTDF